MIVGIPLLTFAFSAINVPYMYFMQHMLYGEFLSEPSFKSLGFAYIMWMCMAAALKWFVMERKDFGFKSVFTHGPFLGLVIYLAINLCLMTVRPDWDMTMVGSDVFFGTLMFGAVTLFGLILKKML